MKLINVIIAGVMSVAALSAHGQATIIGQHPGWIEQPLKTVIKMKMFRNTAKDGGFIMVRAQTGSPLKYGGSDSQSANASSMGVKPVEIPPGYPYYDKVTIGGVQYDATIYRHSARMGDQNANFNVYDIDGNNGTYYQITVASPMMSIIETSNFLKNNVKLLPIEGMTVEGAIKAINDVNAMLAPTKGHDINPEVRFVSATVDTANKVYRRVYLFKALSASTMTDTEKLELNKALSQSIDEDIKQTEACGVFAKNGYTLEIVAKDSAGQTITTARNK